MKRCYLIFARLGFVLSVIVAALIAISYTISQTQAAPVSSTAARPIAGLITPTLPTANRQREEVIEISQQLFFFDLTTNSYQLLGDNDTVFVGETLLYNISLTNASDAPLNNITVFDVLPRNALREDTITCQGCTKITELINQGSSGIGLQAQYSQTRQLRWDNLSLAVGETVQLIFNGTLVCQEDGDTIENGVFVDYGENAQTSDTKITAVTAASEPALGELTLIGPTWCSVGGEFGVDAEWADFDQDGDSDLALATGNGTIVYVNRNGLLAEVWRTESRSPDVAWVDIILGDNQLELLANATPPTFYQLVNSGFEPFATLPQSSSPWRVALADYDGDGDIDVASAPLFDACLVELYAQQSEGVFQYDGCLRQSSNVGDQLMYDLSWGYYDSDNRPDLAVSLVDFISTLELSQVGVFVNQSSNGTRRFSTLQTIANNISVNQAWGDYDQDGNMDLATADSVFEQVRIYGNRGGSMTQTLTITNPFVQAVNWTDFDQDGDLELAAVSSTTSDMSIIDNLTTGSPTLRAYPTGQQGVNFWRISSSDADGDGDLDTIVVNDRQSVVFNNFGLQMTVVPDAFVSQGGLTPSYDDPASSVAWGDYDGDGDLDLLYGAAANLEGGALGTALLENVNLSFRSRAQFSGLGPRDVGFADFNNDRLLDIGLTDREGIDIYSVENTTSPINIIDFAESNSLAWGDYNDDGNLDLLVGGESRNAVYKGTGTGLETSPIWQSANEYDSRSVAWGDYNRDRFLDFAVGNFDGPTEIYCNNRDDTFTLAWQLTRFGQGTTAVAWGDYDADGDPDLAVGNTTTNNLILQNQLCDEDNVDCSTGLPFQFRNVSCTDAINFELLALNDRTVQVPKVSLAWGDAENDGDLDLAVGNYGLQDWVITIEEYADGSDFFFDRNWVSTNAYSTTGVAWGDYDGDGDLDLATSSEDANNVIYRNNYINQAKLLPNNPPAVTIDRPGTTSGGYFYSVGNEYLSGATSPTVTIVYRITDIDGDGIKHTDFEYSVNGGTQWFVATPATTPTTSITPDLLGDALTFLWDAQTDRAISDNALFRITVLPAMGPVSADDTVSAYQIPQQQQANVRGISQPFRVRGITCVWPDNPQIVRVSPLGTTIPLSATAQFQGNVSAGSGQLSFQWVFGDGITQTGQIIQRTFSRNNAETVRLSVTSEECPIAKQVYIDSTVKVGTGVPDTLLPLILRANTTSTRNGSPPAPQTGQTISADLPRITTLSGEVTTAGTRLTWAAVSATGYRVYRQAQGVTHSFTPIATLSSDQTSYLDPLTMCGQMYYVTSLNPQGESAASETSYFSPPCP